LIATPCTGPFLGSVIGFAATVDPFEGFYLFTAIGVGIASPLLFITLFPSLLAWLPKPGIWMITLKQIFGFLFLATGLWLLFVLQAQAPCLSALSVSSGLFFIALALFHYGSFASPLQGTRVRRCFQIISFLLFIAGSLILYSSIDQKPISYLSSLISPKQELTWESFSNEKLENELQKGRIVFVSFTAKWCLTCQVNQIVFHSPGVVDALSHSNIVLLEADWTNRSDEITTTLQSLGRNGVPVYAIFQKGKKPLLLPEILTPHTLIEAIAQVEKTP
jgi:thiol:disulfide interchange protein